MHSTSRGNHVALTLWTDDPLLARIADQAGVDRIGVDLEIIGKQERQAGYGTWISPHTLHDLAIVGQVLSRAELFARLNPLGDATPLEVERALAVGARVLMLPMFETAEEVAEFVRIVRGRATVIGLIETEASLNAIAKVVAVEGLDEVHIGLNDLAIGLGLANRFEVLTLDAVAHAAHVACVAGCRFGIGGIGRADDHGLLVDTDLVYAQLGRLQADSTLLSRSFVDGSQDLCADVARARERLAWWKARPAYAHTAAENALRRTLEHIELPF